MFFEPVTVFRDRLGLKFFPQYFAVPWKQGYQASYLQDGRCSLKVNMLNKSSKQNFIEITLLIIVAPIPKVAKIFFQI